MSTVLTLVVSFIFLSISFRVKTAFFIFVFLIPFLPRYIGIGVGAQGAALSLVRILILILFASFAVYFMQRESTVIKQTKLNYKGNEYLVAFLALFFFIKIIALLLNSFNEIDLNSYMLLFSDLLFGIFLFFITIALVRTNQDVERLIKILFFSYSFVLIFISVEFFVKKPLMSIFASDSISVIRDASRGFERADRYRTTGGFTNPIPLGEFLVVIFPVIFTYLKKNIKSFFSKSIYLAMFIFGVYTTGSRAAILMSVLMFVIWLLLLEYKRGSAKKRLFLIMLAVVLVVTGTYVTFAIVNELISTFSGFYVEGASYMNSLYSRAYQYVEVYNKVATSPYIGFGKNRNYTTLFEDIHAIDNHYFWVLLEVGLIGLFAFLIFYLQIIKTIKRGLIIKNTSHYFVPASTSLITFMLYQFLVAIPTVNTYFYILSALVLILYTSAFMAREKHTSNNTRLFNQ